MYQHIKCQHNLCNFLGGQFCSSNFSELGVATCIKLEAIGPDKPFTFQICCFVSKRDRQKVNLGRKPKPNFTFFYPIQRLGEGLAKSDFKFSLGSNL